MVRASGSTFRDGAGLPEMVVIPARRFLMGSPDAEPGHEDCEYPRREVVLPRPFALGRFAVRFDEWDRFAAATGAPLPHDKGWGRGDRPAVNLSWHDAQRFVAWLRAETGQPYRLPSEAEWEYAARAGTVTPWHWGEAVGPGDANCLVEGSATGGRCTAPVGQFPANGFGLHDMLGNVWEWVEDCWNEFFLGAPGDGSAWTRGDRGRRVLRGGSWQDVPRQIRCASRNRNGAEFPCDDYGVRVARDL